jgi:hypothetical protein
VVLGIVRSSPFQKSIVKETGTQTRAVQTAKVTGSGTR